jgi:hypothetical protein
LSSKYAVCYEITVLEMPPLLNENLGWKCLMLASDFANTCRLTIHRMSVKCRDIRISWKSSYRFPSRYVVTCGGRDLTYKETYFRSRSAYSKTYLVERHHE